MSALVVAGSASLGPGGASPGGASPGGASPGDGVGPGSGGTLRGTVRVPGDKSIAHRALLLAALASGESVVTGLPDGDDVSRTAGAVSRLGVRIAESGVPPRPGTKGTLRITGGRECLRPPDGPLDMGNSGTGLRLLAGLVAPSPWTCTLTGDDSLRRRPMARIAVPLRLMGARVACAGDACTPPVTVTGGRLQGIDYTPPQASAQVKSALLLAGLAAEGETIVRERLATRAHTEEMLARCGAAVRVEDAGTGGKVVRVTASDLDPFTLDVAGDPSHGAFWIVAACIVPGAALTVPGLYIGPLRAGFLDVLARMGAKIDVVHRPGDEPVADVIARYEPLRATSVDAAEVPGLIDEIPVLAVAAATAEGVTTFSGVGELRAKESDRLETVLEMLHAFGVTAEETGRDGLAITGNGGAPLAAAAVDAHLDHRLAMAGAVAGLAACGSTVIRGWEAVATSYPHFAADLAELSR